MYPKFQICHHLSLCLWVPPALHFPPSHSPSIHFIQIHFLQDAFILQQAHPIRDHSTNSSKIRAVSLQAQRITICMYFNLLKRILLRRAPCLASLEHVLSPVTGSLITRHTRAKRSSS